MDPFEVDSKISHAQDQHYNMGTVQGSEDMFVVFQKQYDDMDLGEENGEEYEEYDEKNDEECDEKNVEEYDDESVHPQQQHDDLDLDKADDEKSFNSQQQHNTDSMDADDELSQDDMSVEKKESQSQKHGLQPPPEVLAWVPPFTSFGPQKCGKHRAPISGRSTRGMACVRCSKMFESAWLHALPCGHSLCCRCLHAAVERCWEFLRYRHAQVTANLQLAARTRDNVERAWRGCPAPLSGRWDGRVLDHYLQEQSWREHHARRLEEHARWLEQETLGLAGLTCCGVNMRLEDYLACLEPEAARKLWLAIAWMENAPHGLGYACGWPDCSGFIPRYLSWSSTNTVMERYYYCPICKGISQPQCSPVVKTRNGFPFMKKDDSQLCPARGF